MRFLDQGICDDRTVLKHILQIHQLTVGDGAGHISQIMHMDNPLVVSFHHVFRKDVPPANVLGHFGCEVVPHRAVYDGILVGVFLPRKLVVVPQQRQDLLIGRVLFAENCVP